MSSPDSLSNDNVCDIEPIVKISKIKVSKEDKQSWSNIKDKNDNLEASSSVGVQKICRTCFNFIQMDLSYLPVGSLGSSGYIEKLINVCLPTVNLLLTQEPVICQNCLKVIEEFYNFSVSCMKTETKLQAYYNLNHDSTPINIYDFLQYSIKNNSEIIKIKEEHCSSFQDSFSSDSEDVADLNVKEEDLNSVKNESDNSQSKTKAKRQRLPVIKRKFSSEDLLESQVKCEICNQRFTSKWALDRHTPKHNLDNSPYFCDMCTIKFKYKSSFNKHMIAHATGAPMSKPFACECGKYFNRKSKLKRHQEIHVKKEKPFGCETCGKRFLEEKQLEDHIERVHINEKPFACELCGNKYSAKAGLQLHYKSHFPSDNPRPEPDLMCDVCGKLFYRKYSLEKHRMSHTGDKPHKCDQCSMKFKERYQLTIHMRRHTGEKPFKCEVCGFKVSCKNRLSVHMRKHTGVRPFPCQLCDMAFSRNDHLIKHVRAIHTGERPFECDVCSKTFNRKDYLLKHKKVHLKSHV